MWQNEFWPQTQNSQHSIQPNEDLSHLNLDPSRNTFFCGLPWFHTMSIYPLDLEDVMAWNPSMWSTTADPPVLGDVSMAVDNSNNNDESINQSMDQSTHGFTFLHLNSATLSIGILASLGTLSLILLLAGCCYWSDRQQRSPGRFQTMGRD